MEHTNVNKVRNETMYKGCIHRDSNCDSITSKAHSIQHHGILDSISKNGEVYCIDFGKIDKNGVPEFKLVGKGKASIFTGLCNYHDSRIFKAIEEYDYAAGNIEQNFLFAYRAFALAYYERHSAFEMIKAKRDIYNQSAISTKSIDEYLFMYQQHLSYLEKLRKAMNENLDNKKYYHIYTNTITWNRRYNIAVTSMFFIYKDCKGNLINGNELSLHPFFFSLFPQGNCTIVLMGYLKKDRFRYQFIKNQILNQPVEIQKVIISNIIALYIENYFISPDY